MEEASYSSAAGQTVDPGRTSFDKSMEPRVALRLSMIGFPDLSVRLATVRVAGTLRAPVRGELSQTLGTLIRRGERRVLLDLADLREIDAAGVGELIRAFNALRAAGGVLRIAHANRHVRRLLHIAGVYRLLTGVAQG
jgi:anti-anti-sigma factor